jgi:hypothetical protein
VKEITVDDILKSDWLRTQVELLKSLYGFERKSIDKGCKAIDYLVENDDEQSLLRVFYSSDTGASKASMKTIEETVDKFDEEGYDSAVVVAERFTNSARRLVRKKDGMSYISSKSQYPYSVNELLYAVQQKTWELCEERCGIIPKKESDCKGYLEDKAGGHYYCPVRRISDDSDFHADRHWPNLLISDFCKLIDLE